MTLRRYGIPGAMAALLVTAGTASAQFHPIEPYVGFGAGQSRFDTDGGTFGPLARTDDDKDFAWRLFTGTRMWSFVGIELGYIDFGEITANPTGKADAKGIDLVAVGFLPLFAQGIHGFDVFVKAGAYWWDGSARNLLPGADLDDDDGFDWTAGLGLQYTFGGIGAGRLGVRAEWQRYNDIFDSVDNDVWMGSVVWQF